MHRQNQWQAHGDALEFPTFAIAVELLSSSAAAGGAETRSSFGCAAGLVSGVLGLVSALMGRFLAYSIALALVRSLNELC